MIELILVFSLFGNAFLIWYIVQLLRRFLTFQEELDEFTIKLEEYQKHIEIVHNLERFYGDETLGNLLRHSKAIVDESKQFKAILDYENEVDNEEEENYAEET
jgi:uncharacterized protein YeeX (DUF496 family)